MPEQLNPAQLADRLRADQRARWERGEPLPAEELLRQHPSLLAEPACALQVVYQEILLRERYGEVPRLAEYQERFPQLAVGLRPLFAVHRALESERPLASSPTETARDLKTATATVELPAVPGYEVLEVLGRGGMGVVYKARQVGLNRLVALKMIRAGAHAAPSDRARFRAEAEAQARVQHANIVQVYEVGEWRGCPYLVMEYVDGGSLVRFLGGRPQAPRAAAALIETLAQAMHHAHQQGLVHRDLKPANILLQKLEIRNPKSETSPRDRNPKFQTDNPRVSILGDSDLGFVSDFGFRVSDLTPKIADFGLAKLRTTEPGNTQPGDVLGTPSYMAPEQAEGRPQEIGPATDVYALGAILYELLTGRPPFVSETILDTLAQVRNREPVAPRRLVRDLLRDLEAICLKCLRKEPRRRYADAAALAGDLGRFRRGQPVAARRVTYLERLWLACRRQPLVVLLTVALLLLAGSGLVSWYIGFLLVFSAGNLAIFSLWLRAERQREHAEDSYVRAEADLARARRDQTRAEAEMLEALHHQSLAELRAQRAEGQQRRIVDRERETRAVVQRQVALLQDELARCYHELGNVHGQTGHYAEAVASYERALAIRDRLLAAAPADARCRSFLAVLWNNLGEALRQLGRRDEARHAYLNAVEHQGRAATAGPPEASYQVLLGRHYGNLARVSRELGEWEAAVWACGEGARASSAAPAQLFLLACELAQCGPTGEEGVAEQAVTLLRRALAAGFQDTHQPLREPALAALHRRADFQEMMAAQAGEEEP